MTFDRNTPVNAVTSCKRTNTVAARSGRFHLGATEEGFIIQ
jgi:hypothetical protein